jgi:hypothetical protein
MLRIALKWFYTVLFLSCFSLEASVTLEPYLAQILSLSSSHETESSTNYERKLDGLLYGGRIGYNYLGFSAGLDLGQSNFDAEVSSPVSQVGVWKSEGTSIVGSVNGRYLGIFVGYDFPFLLRAWTSFFPSTRFEFGAGDPLEGEKNIWMGTGISFGLGYTAFPFISFNYEFRSFTFSEQFEHSTQSTKDLSQEFESIHHLLGLSIPLSF